MNATCNGTDERARNTDRPGRVERRAALAVACGGGEAGRLGHGDQEGRLALTAVAALPTPVRQMVAAMRGSLSETS